MVLKLQCFNLYPSSTTTVRRATFSASFASGKPPGPDRASNARHAFGWRVTAAVFRDAIFQAHAQKRISARSARSRASGGFEVIIPSIPLCNNRFPSAPAAAGRHMPNIIITARAEILNLSCLFHPSARTCAARVAHSVLIVI